MILDIEAAVLRCSVKKVFLKISQNSQENIKFMKKETLTQVFFFEICEILKKPASGGCFYKRNSTKFVNKP